MRTRQKSYQDHGITKKEKNYIEEYCRNADNEHRELIMLALSELPPYIQPYIFYSLVENLSYEKICARKDYLYISKGDFYGYRRKAMECIKRWMILYNIWEFKK